MSKPLAGRRAFEARGRRDYTLGRPFRLNALPRTWPSWARIAYTHGYHLQAPCRYMRHSQHKDLHTV